MLSDFNEDLFLILIKIGLLVNFLPSIFPFMDGINILPTFNGKNIPC